MTSGDPGVWKSGAGREWLRGLRIGREKSQSKTHHHQTTYLVPPSLRLDAGGWRRVAQELCGLFRGCGVDVEAGSPLKSRQFGELRHNFHVPVKIVLSGFSNRRGVDNVVICGKIKHPIQTREHVFEHRSELFKLALLRLFKGALVRFRQDPCFERET